MQYFVKYLVGAIVEKAVVPLSNWIFKSLKRILQRVKTNKKVDKYEKSGDLGDLSDIEDDLNK